MSRHTLEDVIGDQQLEGSLSVEMQAPRKYKVVLQNDDYTPMDFVVDVLKRFFHLSEEMAVQVMLQVHLQGRGVCGIFTRDIAETKVALVNEHARNNQHPLLASMEPE